MISASTSSLSSSTKKSIKKGIFSIGMLMPITKKNNSDFFLRMVDAVCELGFNVFVLAEGDSDAQNQCFEFMKKYPMNFKLLENVPKNRKTILDNSNVVIFPTEANSKLLHEVMIEGIVPILPKQKGVENFDAQKESGNAFTFSKNSFWEFFVAVIRASENFKFSYDWKNLQENVKETAL